MQQTRTYQQLLAITQSMLALAKNNEWEKLSEQEQKRQQVIATCGLKGHHQTTADTQPRLENSSVSATGSNSEILQLLHETANINAMITRLAQAARKKHKTSLLQLQKGKKAKTVYCR